MFISVILIFVSFSPFLLFYLELQPFINYWSTAEMIANSFDQLIGLSHFWRRKVNICPGFFSSPNSKLNIIRLWTNEDIHLGL